MRPAVADAMEIPAGYRAHSAETLGDYLASVPDVARKLGGEPRQWRIEEVGDGNLNLVFKVRNGEAGVAVKQALPYVRLVGKSWPLPLNRAHYETMALRLEARHAPGLVPDVLHYDERLALIVMELLEPHVIMRRGMIAATRYPRFANDITAFMARTLYFSSDLALTAEQKKMLIGDFAGNTALCKITEDLIFTEPYMDAPRNRWTSPQLDPTVAALQADGDLKVAISRLKLKFMGSAEALIHGDLHTGSVMVTERDTRVIDPEFAFMGPMGFDIGAILANLLMSYFSQEGHEERPGAREPYRAWILETVEEVWTGFRAKFLELWRHNPTGDGYPKALFADPAGSQRLAIEREAYMDRLFEDTLGFAAAKMIRRIVGLAHNIDFEWIKDPDMRAKCEARSLRLARELMVNASSFRTIAAVTSAARDINRWISKLV
jgi:5-methylthioribose kinase